MIQSSTLLIIYYGSATSPAKPDFAAATRLEAILIQSGHKKTTALGGHFMLPNSSIKLYQLFPSDLLEQMRIKLEILHDLLGSKSQYATVEAKNGKFCRFDL